MEVEIPAAAVDEDFKKRLFALIGRIAAPEPARKVPSFAECRFCDIARTHCPERVEQDEGLAKQRIFSGLSIQEVDYNSQPKSRLRPSRTMRGGRWRIAAEQDMMIEP